MEKFIKIIQYILILTYIGLIFIPPGIPPLKYIREEVINTPPQQTLTNISSFESNYSDYTYDFEPLYNYDIYGLVVEEYSSNNWLDYSHKKDPANTRDLCLVWGENISNGSYKKVKYSHGEFTCFYRWSANIDPPFNNGFLSNNHLVPKNKTVENKIKRVDIGDQVHIKGYLVNYKTTDSKGNESGWRNTSTERSDSRGGACEIIYVDEIEVLKSYNNIYYALKTFLPLILVVTYLYKIIRFLFK